MIYYSRNLRYRANDLRKNMTPWERHLWYDFLRKYSVRFIRQMRIGGYIVDFYCARAKIVIELDGSEHYTQERRAYDEIRTKYLAAQGLKVIRFSNLDVKNNFYGVCSVIDRVVRARLNPSAEKPPTASGPPSFTKEGNSLP